MSSVKVACDIFWAFTQKVSEMSQKYEITFGNLSPAAVTNLNGMGIKTRSRADKPEQGNYLTCKSLMPIEVFDANGNKLEALIGNGSKGIATLSPYEWANKFGKGISPSLKKLVVTDLVHMTGTEEDDAPVF